MLSSSAAIHILRHYKHVCVFYMLSKIMVITISVHGHVILLFIFQGLYNEDFFVKTKEGV